MSDTYEHPAKFTAVLIDKFAEILNEPLVIDPVRILDPFAGTGRIHLLRTYSTMFETLGVEIEPEWATMHPDTVVADAHHLPFRDGWFDAIVTSPCYGNRMADHHNAKDGSRRVTYRHLLKRPLHPNSSAQMQWGDRYRRFHVEAWEEARRVLRVDGRFVLNISDHIRKGKRQRVTAWHVDTLLGLGFELESCHRIPTPRFRFGQNASARIQYESIIVFTKGGDR